MTAPTSDEQVEAVARAIIGPHQPVPEGSRFTLEGVRQLRWERLTTQEQAYARIQARAIIAALTQLEATTPATSDMENP